MAWNADAALSDLEPGLTDLAARWARSPTRPRVQTAILDAWDDLLDQWLSSDLPLPCRTPNYGRGARDIHSTGRILTCADNTPAQWSMAQAISGTVPTLHDIAALFSSGRMPLAFALKKTEQERLAYTRGGLSSKLRLNRDGWKICHIEPVGLGWVGHPTTAPVDRIYSHFRRFLSPRNMFLLPLSIGGLGETPQMLAAMKADAEQAGGRPSSSTADMG